MPSASDESRKEWGVPYLDENGNTQWYISESKAYSYLTTKGYTLTYDWRWKRPSTDYQPTDKECSAVQFLMDEWDYDGII